MDRYLTLQRSTPSRGTGGGATRTWATMDTVMGERLAPSGSEARKANAIRADANELFKIRYYAGLTSKDRVVYEGQTYDILAVLEDHRTRRQWMFLPCRYTEGKP